jgi:predicted RNA-binding Zn ribbon-like protein
MPEALRKFYDACDLADEIMPPGCGWVFYDRSKNRSRRWCEQATCANLMKVRRFHQKHRQKMSPI